MKIKIQILSTIIITIIAIGGLYTENNDDIKIYLSIFLLISCAVSIFLNIFTGKTSEKNVKMIESIVLSTKLSESVRGFIVDLIIKSARRLNYFCIKEIGSDKFVQLYFTKGFLYISLEEINRLSLYMYRKKALQKQINNYINHKYRLKDFKSNYNCVLDEVMDIVALTLYKICRNKGVTVYTQKFDEKGKEYIEYISIDESNNENSDNNFVIYKDKLLEIMQKPRIERNEELSSLIKNQRVVAVE